MKEFSEKVVVVTGAAGGIGKACAEAFAAEGAAVALLDLDLAGAEAAAAGIRATGAQAMAARIDVTDPASAAEAHAAVREALGEAHVLVNNAGLCTLGPILSTTAAEWERHFAINTHGPFHVARAFAPAMVARGAGAVVNMASWMGKRAVGTYGAYCASKFAVVGFTQALSDELAPHGVRVNAIAPGMIVNTRMRDASDLERAAHGLPTAAERARSEIPLGRPGYPVDIAEAAVFLASPRRAGFITGECLSVTGGMWND